jgi:hypothetical protein
MKFADVPHQIRDRLTTIMLNRPERYHAIGEAMPEISPMPSNLPMATTRAIPFQVVKTETGI